MVREVKLLVGGVAIGVFVCVAAALLLGTTVTVNTVEQGQHISGGRYQLQTGTRDGKPTFTVFDA